MISYRLVDRHQYFGGTSCLQLYGRRMATPTAAVSNIYIFQILNFSGTSFYLILILF
jgi:hypothetical protein